MRHRKVQKRQIEPDMIYNNLLLAKLINRMMKDGKKTVAEKKMYAALELLKSKNLDPIETFEKAVANIAPKVEVKARRIGGANFQVPIEVRAERKNSLAIRWLLEAATKKANKEFHTFEEKLANELMAAANNEGEAVRKKEVMHKQAEANKAFSHFRW
jgi:small subunit ribosomal protein S7